MDLSEHSYVLAAKTVLLLLIRCGLLLPLWDSVIALCFVVRYFVSILVLQSSQWGRESWLPCFVFSSWCLVIVVWLFLTMPWVCLQFVTVVFSDHTHLLFFFDIFLSTLTNGLVEK